MLSTEQIKQHVGRLAYKDGWRFEVYDGAWEGPHVVITAKLPNSYGEGAVDIGVHSMIPPMESTAQLERWVAWRLARLEVHEMREFLKRDGSVIFDPHAPGANEDRG